MIASAVAIAVRELARRPIRSLLTTLGIIIGVAAVIAMVSLGEGARERVIGEVAALGDNLVIVSPSTHGNGRDGRPRAFDLRDVTAVAAIDGVAAVAPVTSRRVRAVRASSAMDTTVQGTEPTFLAVRRWTIDRGRMFTDAEARAGSPVCVVGATVRDELFGPDHDEIGATIRLDRMTCEIIGVLGAKGEDAFGHDQDDFVLLPLTTFHRRMAANAEVGVMFVSAASPAAVPGVVGRIHDLLRERRRLRAGEEDDFRVRDLQEVGALVRTIGGVLTATLAGIAAISLFVGGIGIMNVMLASVTERTREIGVRLAIGARGRDVLLQFLIEALVLSLAGGAVGVLLGLVVAACAARALQLPFVVVPGAAVLAFLVSAVVGVAAGSLPARRAARLDPIVALRRD